MLMSTTVPGVLPLSLLNGWEVAEPEHLLGSQRQKPQVGHGWVNSVPVSLITLQGKGHPANPGLLNQTCRKERSIYTLFELLYCEIFLLQQLFLYPINTSCSFLFLCVHAHFLPVCSRSTLPHLFPPHIQNENMHMRLHLLLTSRIHFPNRSQSDLLSDYVILSLKPLQMLLIGLSKQPRMYTMTYPLSTPLFPSCIFLAHLPGSSYTGLPQLWEHAKLTPSLGMMADSLSFSSQLLEVFPSHCFLCHHCFISVQCIIECVTT